MKFIELFAGIGGFRYGLEKANDTVTKRIQQGIQQRSKNNSTIIKSFLGTKQFTCVWANEIEKYACQIYRKNFGKKELIEGNIRKIPAKSIPNHNLLTAGFPCQSFSIAGKRKGFRDTRGTLFFEICRIVEEKKPNLLLLENVKGLLNHDGGNTFRIILNSLSELGYNCEWEVLNSKNFGVPQNRERVFIIGHLRGTGGQKVFPIGEDGGIFNEKNPPSGSYLKSPIRGQGDGPMIYDIYNQNLRANQDLAGTLKSEGISETSLGTALILRDGRDKRSCLKEGRTTEVGIEGQSIRRLTPTECERLQGFPDGWTEGISDTQRYKCLGNAVTVNVIEEIGKRIIQKNLINDL